MAPGTARGPQRVVTVLLGLLFLGIAGYLAVEFPLRGDPLRLGATVVLALLGGEAVVNAARGKPTLLERLGPLP